MSMDYYTTAIEAAWSEYDYFMRKTGQWMDEEEYMDFCMQKEHEEQERAAHSYDLDALYYGC